MKFKKITSLLISATMAFSAFAAVVNAAANDGNPDITFSATLFDDATVQEWGWGDYMEEGYGIYLLNVNLSDINLSHTSRKVQNGPVSKTLYSGAHMTDCTFAIKGVQLLADASANEVGFAWSVAPSTDLNDSTIVRFNYGSTAGATTSFPTTIGANVTAIDGWASMYVKAPLGATIDMMFKEMNLITYNDSEKGTPSAATLDVTPYTLPAPEGGEEDTLTFEIATGEIWTNGTVWACEIKNAKDGLAQLNATFTGTKEGQTVTKEVVTTKLGEWGGVGATEFNIGINTSKAGVVANAINATITDGTGATANYSASAVEKAN